jgi:glycosyltransferase involved in cell wall biosynthesis
MRVLHVAQSLQGGPASYFDELIPHQIEVYGAKNVSILVPADDIRYLSEGPLTADVHTFSTRQRSLTSLLEFAERTETVQRMVRPDILHLHSTYAGAIGRLVNLFRLPGHRPAIVYCAHGWAFEREGSMTDLGRSAVITAERWLGRMTDTVINLSESDEKQTTQLRIAPGHTRIVENAIAPKALGMRDRVDLVRELGLPSGVTNILFVGRLDRQKGFDVAIDVMRQLQGQPFHLCLIGQSVTDAPPVHLDLPGNITHIPWIPREDVFKYYDACDLLMMPSRWEGLPITLLEAMRAGLPTLGSNKSSLPGIIEDGRTGRVAETFSANTFAQILLETEKSQWRCYGEQARQKFELKYKSEKLHASLDDLYCKLVSSRA